MTLPIERAIFTSAWDSRAWLPTVERGGFSSATHGIPTSWRNFDRRPATRCSISTGQRFLSNRAGRYFAQTWDQKSDLHRVHDQRLRGLDHSRWDVPRLPVSVVIGLYRGTDRKQLRTK